MSKENHTSPTTNQPYKYTCDTTTIELLDSTIKITNNEREDTKHIFYDNLCTVQHTIIDTFYLRPIKAGIAILIVLLLPATSLIMLLTFQETSSVTFAAAFIFIVTPILIAGIAIQSHTKKSRVLLISGKDTTEIRIPNTEEGKIATDKIIEYKKEHYKNNTHDNTNTEQ